MTKIRWEYKVRNTQWVGSVTGREMLNEYGRDGWELISVIDYLVGLNRYNKYFFKRRKNNDEE